MKIQILNIEIWKVPFVIWQSSLARSRKGRQPDTELAYLIILIDFKVSNIFEIQAVHLQHKSVFLCTTNNVRFLVEEGYTYGVNIFLAPRTTLRSFGFVKILIFMHSAYIAITGSKALNF